MSKIGTEIQKIRLQKNITTKQLAKKIGVNEKNIMDIETGKTIIKDSILRKIEKALDTDIQNHQFSVTKEEFEPETMEELLNSQKKSTKKPIKKEHVWESAFTNAFAELPVYAYNLKSIESTKRLPIINNKVEGFSKEKLFYLKVNDLEMNGFRIRKNDNALCFKTKEFNKNGIYFIEFNGQRMIREIKHADQLNYYVISQPSDIRQLKVAKKSIQILAKIIKIEFYL